jgi:hypothetical protein
MAIKKDKFKNGPEGFTKEQIKQINKDTSYLNSHTITTIDDVKKRLEGMKKSEEFNKNLKYEQDFIDIVGESAGARKVHYRSMEDIKRAKEGKSPREDQFDTPLPKKKKK